MDHIFIYIFTCDSAAAYVAFHVSGRASHVTWRNRLDMGGSVFAGVGRPLLATCYMEIPRLSWSSAPANRHADQIWHWSSNSHPTQISPSFHNSGCAFVGEPIRVHETRHMNHSQIFGCGLQSVCIHRAWRVLSKQFYQWVVGTIEWCLTTLFSMYFPSWLTVFSALGALNTVNYVPWQFYTISALWKGEIMESLKINSSRIVCAILVLGMRVVEVLITGF